jgi:hypothetical protein
MYGYAGSIWQYGWVLPVVMVVFCLLMIVILRGRCRPMGGWRHRSDAGDDPQKTGTFPPRKEITGMDAFRQRMGRLVDR